MALVVSSNEIYAFDVALYLAEAVYVEHSCGFARVRGRIQDQMSCRCIAVR
jgi:hypothetical protein